MKSIFPLKTTFKFIMSTEINNQVISMKSKKMTEKAEKLKLKETEKAEKLAAKESIKAEKQAKKECAKADKVKQASERVLLRAEENQLKKAEKLAAKEAEKAEKLAAKAEKLRQKEAEKLAAKAEKPKKMKKNKEESVSTSTVPSSSSEEPFVRFQNVSLIDEINSILNVKKYKNWKKLSAGVKLARQLLDI